MMAHIRIEVTEERVAREGWPCHLCINGERFQKDPKTLWRDGFCNKCRKEDSYSKPSEFCRRRLA